MNIPHFYPFGGPIVNIGIVCLQKVVSIQVLVVVCIFIDFHMYFGLRLMMLGICISILGVWICILFVWIYFFGFKLIL